MRRRTTFRDLNLRVGPVDEVYLYGPKSAQAYAQIKPLRDKLRREILKEIAQRRYPIHLLHKYGGYPSKDACRIASQLGLCQRGLGPTFCDLDRLGYDRIYAAADADTWTYSNAMDAGRPEPFTPCDSPREAWERYGVTA